MQKHLWYKKVWLSKVETEQKHLWCKKGEANQKQQISNYGYIAILATKSFDIS